MAGFICNVISAGYIPITALLSLAIYGELLGPTEALGIFIVFGAILVLTLAKFWENSSASNSSEAMASGEGDESLGHGEKLKLLED